MNEKYSKFKIYVGYDMESHKWKDYDLILLEYKDAISFKYEDDYDFTSKTVLHCRKLSEILIYVDLFGNIPLVNHEFWKEIEKEEGE